MDAAVLAHDPLLALDLEVRMSNAVARIPQEQLASMADNCVKSGLFGIKTREQAMALMALCEAEGLHPAKAMQEYNIIQGRPALRADAMLARFQRAGGVVNWECYTEEKVSAYFSHPQSSPKPVLIEWTLAQAKRIGLAGKDNWTKYGRAMLRSRVISEGVRTVYPGITTGIYTEEEVRDMPAPGVRDMGAAEVVAEVDVPSYISAIRTAQTKADLQEEWKAASAACAAAGDRDAYDKIKAEVTERLKVLPEAEAA